MNPQTDITIIYGIILFFLAVAIWQLADNGKGPDQPA